MKTLHPDNLKGAINVDEIILVATSIPTLLITLLSIQIVCFVAIVNQREVFGVVPSQIYSGRKYDGRGDDCNILPIQLLT